MKKLVGSLLVTGVMMFAGARAQAQSSAVPPPVVPVVKGSLTSPFPDLKSTTSSPLPRMSPELVLQLFSERLAAQPDKLAGYTDTTTIEAELPDTAQKGEYQLIRSFTAPHSLSFATVKFTGDGFVKTNVIVRLLQQEVEHVEKGDPSKTAITEQNYKFNYKGVETVDGNLCHVFQLKPRRKTPGLFKGRIYIDSHSASLRRAEGTLAKSPSFFVKKIDFVQDFTDIAGFTFPAKLRSTAKARIIGRAVVNIFHEGYKLEAKATPPAGVESVNPTGTTH